MIKMDNFLHPNSEFIQRCPRCSAPLKTIVVHGHEACITCKSNIMECCTGDNCNTDYNLAIGYERF